MIIALPLMRQSEGRKIQEDDMSVAKISLKSRAQMSPLFLCVALLAVVGALSLAIVDCFCGMRMI